MRLVSKGQDFTLLRNLDISDKDYTAQQMDIEDRALDHLVRCHFVRKLDGDCGARRYRITHLGKKRLHRELDEI